MTPLVFIDTEADGVHHGRRVWEVAMIRRDDEGQRETQFFVALDMRHSDPFGLQVGGFWDRHPSGRKVSGKPPLPGPAPLCKHDAAKEVMRWTFGAHLVGAVPNFDAETLAGLLRAEGYLPSWHYHLIDVEAMAVGWLRMASRIARDEEDHNAADLLDMDTAPPWKSDTLSRACGVEPPSDAERHSALGDARWAMRWYDAMTGGAS
jgi:hypothetical protein